MKNVPPNKSKFSRTIGFVGRKALVWLVIGTSAGLLTSVLELGISFLMQILIYQLGLTSQKVTLPHGFTLPDLSIKTFAIVLLTVAVLRGLGNFLIVQSAVVANEILNARLRLLVFYESLTMKSGFLSLAQINLRIGEIFPKATSFCYYCAMFAPVALHNLLLIGFMVFYSWKATLIGMSGLAVVGVVILRLNSKIKGISAQVPVEFEHMTRSITRVVKNWFLLKALRTTDIEHQKLISNTLGYSSHSIRANFLLNCSAVLPSVFGVALLMVIIFFQVKYREIPALSFLAFLYLFLRFVQQLTVMTNYAGYLYTFRPHFKAASQYFLSFEQKDLDTALQPERLLNLRGGDFAEIQKRRSAPLVASSGAGHDLPAPEIICENLDFKYGDDREKVLKNLSFKITHGSQFGIIGRSGAGKSTLLGIIMGVLKPTAGSVVIDGQTPEKYFSDPRRRLGYVGAEPFLIEGTVRANLCYGISHAPNEPEIIQALEDAKLGPWLASLENGLDYLISENGEGLSTGQKQRLSLARALLGRPQILILDEISANLDDATETEVAQSISKLRGRCTMVIVSHRKGLLENVEGVLKL